DTLILQPVLDFNGEKKNEWAIESEFCCASGNDVQSEIIQVSPGDLIIGTVKAATCDSSGVCTNWTVITNDMTSGKTTTLTMQNPKEVANTVNPMALETYSVTSCDMFPANGELTAFNNIVTDANGATVALKYEYQSYLNELPSTFPMNCGYR